MITDKVGNLLTCIRNGLQRGKSSVVVPDSKFLRAILSVLFRQGYISGYECVDLGKNKSCVKVQLKYYSPDNKSNKSSKSDKIPVISKIDRISTPGRRCYSSAKKISQPFSGLGIMVMSTSRGVLSGKESKDYNVGGEVLFEVF